MPEAALDAMKHLGADVAVIGRRLVAQARHQVQRVSRESDGRRAHVAAIVGRSDQALRLLPGEDLDEDSPEAAFLWARVYGELVQGVETFGKLWHAVDPPDPNHHLMQLRLEQRLRHWESRAHRFSEEPRDAPVPPEAASPSRRSTSR